MAIHYLCGRTITTPSRSALTLEYILHETLCIGIRIWCWGQDTIGPTVMVSSAGTIAKPVGIATHENHALVANTATFDDFEDIL